jgi:IS30 family transposase
MRNARLNQKELNYISANLKKSTSELAKKLNRAPSTISSAKQRLSNQSDNKVKKITKSKKQSIIINDNKSSNPFYIAADLHKSALSKRGSKLIDLLVESILKLYVSDIESVVVNSSIVKTKKDAVNLVTSAKQRIKKSHPERYYVSKTVKGLNNEFVGIRIYREA